MRVTFIFLISFILTTLNVDAQAQTEFAFPFDTTAKWEYDLMSSFDWQPVGHSVFQLHGDTTMPNGKSYRPFCDGSRAIFYFRKDSSRIVQYRITDSTEFVRYDFSTVKGDTLVQFGNYPAEVLTADSFKPVFGLSTRVKSFTGGYDVYDDVADSIGILKFDYGVTDSWYQLTGAIIGGRTYGTVTSITDKEQLTVQYIQLHQNYPNPFNPSTTISFDLPKPAKVTLKIYNVLGKEIASLIDGETFSAGSHSQQWNASQFASSVYFYKLTAGNFMETKKLLLLK